MLPITIDGVSFSYTPEAPVLTDVSLQFKAGATAVIGQNGAGKTTLMKLLNGLLKPVTGSVRIGAIDTREHPTSAIARHVGLVFQNPDDQIFKHRVKDEVEFGPLNIGKSAAQAQELALTALERVGLRAKVDENPYDLSYAERKQICVASILAMDTRVVVFDEPTISQDAVGVRRMGEIVRGLADEGKTVISIVHDMNFVAEYFDWVVVMANGRVLQTGSPEAVFQNKMTLALAHVEAPAMGKLSTAMGMSNFSLTVESFVAEFAAEFVTELQDFQNKLRGDRGEMKL
ncbi:MAG: hypothetical protein A2201_00055 [Alicyclobacillus sp. RIFOXYA1_FULL_53_8]|nr:MAG: hypothetical protein A2201_00055 [Alicyclobacillus sp. RIFOXYA1_FULL_53_8]